MSNFSLNWSQKNISINLIKMLYWPRCKKTQARKQITTVLINTSMWWKFQQDSNGTCREIFLRSCDANFVFWKQRENGYFYNGPKRSKIFLAISSLLTMTWQQFTQTVKASSTRVLKFFQNVIRVRQMLLNRSSSAICFSKLSRARKPRKVIMSKCTLIFKAHNNLRSRFCTSLSIHT